MGGATGWTLRPLVIGALLSVILPAGLVGPVGGAVCTAGSVVTLSEGIGMSTGAETFTTEG